MKNKEIDFTAEEFDFLRSLNLNLTYQEKLYFDYDFIINNIDKTPNEILNMEDGLDKRTLLWFDDLFAIKLNEFYGKAYSEHFMNELNIKDEKCPLNDKDSNEYKEYINFKKVFATSMKMLNESEILSQLDRQLRLSDYFVKTDSVEEYTKINTDLIGEDYKKVDKDFLDIKEKIGIYCDVIDDSNKPTLPEDITFSEICAMMDASNNGGKLSEDKSNIVNYINSCLGLSSLSASNNIVNDKLKMFFIIRALIDNKKGVDYHEEYAAIFSCKNDISQDIKEAYAGGYKTTPNIWQAATELDSKIKEVEVCNKYQAFGLNLFENTEFYHAYYDHLAYYDHKKITPEELSKRNSRFFDRYDNGKKVEFKLGSLSSTEMVPVTPILTDQDIEEDKQKIEEALDLLEQNPDECQRLSDIIEIIDKKLSGNELTLDEQEFLNENGIDASLEDEELRNQKADLEKQKQEISITPEEIKTRKSALNKAGSLVEYNRKLAKAEKMKNKLKGKVKNLKNLANLEILKKWAKKLPKVVCPIIGGAVGYNLAFVLGPVGIVAANAIGAIIITQARAYANILEEQELSEEEIEIDSIEKPSNKLCNKVSALLRTANLEKLATFNMFEKLSKSKSEKISNFFSNKEVLITIANTVTAGLVAMDLNALRRVISKLAKHQNEIPKKEFESDSNLGANKGEIKPSTGTGSESGSGLTSGAGNTNEISMKVGENIGTESKIINGYKNSYDAYNGVNGVHLNQSIINDGDTIIKNLYYNSNGKMIKLPIEHGQDIIETIENLGINPKDVVANLANSDGTGRAWVHITDVAKTLGRSL